MVSAERGFDARGAVDVTEFAPDLAVLKAIWLMLAVEDEFLRVSWSPGATLPALELPVPVTEEQTVQRLVAEFDAEELTGRERALALKGVVDDEPRPELVSYDFAVSDGPGDWLAMVARMCADREVRLGAGSRRRRGFGTCDCSRVLWARVGSRKEVANLRRFRPRPTLVVREGSTCRLVALWSLRRPLTYEWLVRANRRIAHRLFGPKKWAEPEFEFPVPGSCLRAGRARPVPVHAVLFEASVYEPRQVVGGLKDAPDPNAWREAA